MPSTESDSSGPVLTIAVAGKQHASAVARLHILYIADDSLLKLPKTAGGLIGDYYDDLLGRDNSLILVALAGDEVIGYASLVARHTRVLWRLTVRQPVLVLKILGQVRLWYPMVRYMVRRVSLELLGRKWPRGRAAKLLRGACELRAVAVKPSWRGRSIASTLLVSALQQAATRQWTPVVAWVEQDNLASNKAFLKAGFELVDKRTDRHGTANLYRWVPEVVPGTAAPLSERDEP